MTKFQEAMRTQCSHCGEQAQNHRLTPTGNFYCLKFNQSNTWGNNLDRDQKRFLMMRCKVNQLIRSPLPTGLGRAINGALTGYVPIDGGTS